jgi:phosphoglycolate phosphatase
MQTQARGGALPRRTLPRHMRRVYSLLFGDCHMTAPHDLVLLDLDGTLSDPLLGIGRSINHALAHFGYAELELSALAIYIGPPLDQAFRSITGCDSPGELAALIAKYRERYGEIGYAENTLYPGVTEALRDLANAGVPLAVCTSKRADFAEKILELFDLRPYFRFVSGGEVGVHKWQQIEALAKQRHVTPSTVMVGDRAFDLVAAHRNGLHAAGVLWGHGSRAELENERPRYLFSSPAELRTFIR